MLETYEIRIFDRYADLFDGVIPSAEKSSHGILALTGTVGDQLYLKIGQLHQQMAQAGLSSIFSHSEITRTYSREELDSAELFLPRILFTHLAGEEHGTRYKEATDCEQQAFDFEFPNSDFSKPVVVPVRVPCGLCSRQSSLLRVPFRRLAKKRPIQLLWGGEYVISAQLAQSIRTERLAGATLYPMRNLLAEPVPPLDLGNQAGERILELAATAGLNPEQLEFWEWLYKNAPKQWLDDLLIQQREMRPEGSSSPLNFFQLLTHSRMLETSERSHFGDNPFDRSEGGSFRCKSGAIAGRNLISPLSILRSSWDGSDFCRTRLWVGGRQGLFRPYPLLVVSRRFVQALERNGIRGINFEIVEIV